MRLVRALLSDERGVAFPEYALALALISLGAATALAGVAVACSVAFGNTTTAMQTFTASAPP
jgi:Flp pilus assembly pilin Flp